MKKSTVKKIYFFIVLIFSGFGLPFFREPMAGVYLFLLTAGMFVIFEVKASPTFTKIVSIWLIYCLSFMLRYGIAMESFTLRHLTYIMATYLFVRLYKHSFFLLYENLVYYLAAVSLFFFIWELIDFNSLYQFMNKFNLVRSSGEIVNENSKSILIYTLHSRSISIGSIRNCGFTWEPGPFSIFLSLAIYLNMLRTNVKIKKNIRFFILLLALATTQSTTGFIAISLVFLEIVFSEQKGIKKYVILILLTFIFGFLFFNLDFLSEKVFGLYESGDAETIIAHAEQTGNRGSFGRFAGFSIGWADFKNQPLFGYAGVSSLSVTSELGSLVNMVSGLATLIGMYGLFGIVVLAYFLRKSSIFIAQLYGGKTKYSLAIIMIIGLISFHIHTMIMLFAFMFISFFTGKSIIYTENVINQEIPSTQEIDI